MAIMSFSTGEWIKNRVGSILLISKIGGQGTSRTGFKASISID